MILLNKEIMVIYHFSKETQNETKIIQINHNKKKMHVSLAVQLKTKLSNKSSILPLDKTIIYQYIEYNRI